MLVWRKRVESKEGHAPCGMHATLRRSQKLHSDAHRLNSHDHPQQSSSFSQTRTAYQYQCMLHCISTKTNLVQIRLDRIDPPTLIYYAAKLRRPDASRPTSEICVILQSVPLNSGRYRAPVSGSVTDPAPAAVIKR